MFPNPGLKSLCQPSALADVHLSPVGTSELPEGTSSNARYGLSQRNAEGSLGVRHTAQLGNRHDQAWPHGGTECERSYVAVRRSMKYETPKNLRNARQGQGKYLRSVSRTIIGSVSS